MAQTQGHGAQGDEGWTPRGAPPLTTGAASQDPPQSEEATQPPPTDEELMDFEATLALQPVDKVPQPPPGNKDKGESKERER